MPIYFAYGANMDRAAMAERCPRSTPIGLARLARHTFAIMPNGWGNVAPAPGKTAHGVLWNLDFRDVPALDAFEDVDSGLYRKIVKPVVKADGGSVAALIYIGEGEGGRPRPEYLAGVVAAARAWGLPADYVADIERLGR
jgi:gamma-glutamylcyclotransferase (GGCT)/AIG2-like uncharacterized protein YtfP